MPSVLHLYHPFHLQYVARYSARLFQRSGMVWFLGSLLVCYALMIPIPAFAWTYYLQQDLGVQGLVHLCKYSNGKVYTFNATELCPLSIEDGAPGFGQGQGVLQGEHQDGMTKVCLYEVMGERKAIRLPSISLCPLNSRF